MSEARGEGRALNARRCKPGALAVPEYVRADALQISVLDHPIETGADPAPSVEGSAILARENKRVLSRRGAAVTVPA